MLGSLDKVLFKPITDPSTWTLKERTKALVSSLVEEMVNGLSGPEKMFAKDAAKMALPKIYKGIDEKDEAELVKLMQMGTTLTNHIVSALQENRTIDVGQETQEVILKLGEGAEHAE